MADVCVHVFPVPISTVSTDLSLSVKHVDVFST